MAASTGEGVQTTNRALSCIPGRSEHSTGTPPVGVKVFLEGEEEIGSLHLDAFLAEYESLLASDAIVIADAGTWKVGEPGLTTSLRGLVDCTIEVATLAERRAFRHVGRRVPRRTRRVGQGALQSAR